MEISKNQEAFTEFDHETKRLDCIFRLKVKTSIENAPISKNEMEAFITTHVKEYVLTNT